MEAGSVADLLLLFSLTTIPPFGAVPSRATVAVDVVPPTRVAGSSVIEAMYAGLIVSDAAWVTVPTVATMIAVVGFVTTAVCTVKVAVDAPPGILTVPGMPAALLLFDNVAVKPLGGATPLNVNVPVEDAPPPTTDGFRVIDINSAGLTVRNAVWGDCPLRVAVTTAYAGAVTGIVGIWKVTVDWPAGIVTAPGGITALLLLPTLTTSPPVGAT